MSFVSHISEYANILFLHGIRPLVFNPNNKIVTNLGRRRKKNRVARPKNAPTLNW